MKTHQSPTPGTNPAHSSNVTVNHLVADRKDNIKIRVYTAFHKTLVTLFNHMPKNLTTFEQLNIWLERQRTNFYLNYTDVMLSRVDVLCRPKTVVTRELYRRYVPPIAIETLSKIATLFASISTNQAAAAYVQDIKLGRYHDIIQILIKTEECWSTFQTYQKQIKESLINRPTTDVRVSSSDTVINYVHEPYSDRPTDHRHQTSGTEVLDLSQNQIDQSNVLVNRLWALRNTLQASLQLDATQSWHDKLQNHLPLLRKHLGNQYKLPATAAECMADMTLITLHTEIQQYQY